MTDHLPECLTPDPASPEILCICDRLRACEQRLTGKVWEASGVDVYRYGYTAGVQAARDAVAALNPFSLGCECGPDALAAIDALRGDK